jgi:hypothetical protein
MKMKDKEVIEILNDMKGVFGKRGHSQYSLYSIDRAIAVIEKQIPVKGLIEKYETINGGVLGEGRVCVCPICKEAIVPVSYCGECGQKLDWD